MECSPTLAVTITVSPSPDVYYMLTHFVPIAMSDRTSSPLPKKATLWRWTGIAMVTTAWRTCLSKWKRASTSLSSVQTTAEQVPSSWPFSVKSSLSGDLWASVESSKTVSSTTEICMASLAISHRKVESKIRLQSVSSSNYLQSWQECLQIAWKHRSLRWSRHVSSMAMRTLNQESCHQVSCEGWLLAWHSLADQSWSS